MTETPSTWTARVPKALRSVARSARTTVRSAFPDFVEHARPGLILYGRTKAPRDWRIYISMHRDHLNLGFYRGLASNLPDPKGIIEGSGKTMRHIKLRSVADVKRPALKAILRSAAKAARAQATKH